MVNVKLERTLSRFQTKIEEGQFYEAHQTLRTIVNRYVKSKQFGDALDLLYRGAAILSSKGEFASSSDLILYYIATLQEANISNNEEDAGKDAKLKIIELVNLLPDTDSSLADISSQTMIWSKNSGGGNFGDPSLHDLFGHKFLNGVTGEECKLNEEDKKKVFAYAETHLIIGTHESLVAYTDFLWKWFELAKDPVDPGLFLARAVVNYAYLKNMKFVQESMTRFMDLLLKKEYSFEIIKAEGEQIYYYKEFLLINFLQLLVITLSKEAADKKFLKLYEHYKPLLKKYLLDTDVEYLGRLYFQLNLGNSMGGQNFLSNLMGGLFK